MAAKRESGRRNQELPDDIIQHIQSFLETEEATLTRLVSKSWLRAWSTRPFLIFDPWLDKTHNPICNKHIDRTLESYVDRGLPIVKFHVFFYTIQERWFKMLRKSNVIELQLISRSNWKDSLFQEIFKVKSLQVLNMVSLEITQLFIVLNHSDIKCLNLRRLELKNFRIGEATFEHIMSSCALIEELVLSKCDMIEIPSYNRGSQSCMFAGECASLKKLTLVETQINDEQLQGILYKCPQLEDLKLIGCKMLVKPINLSSVALKRVNIDGGKSLNPCVVKCLRVVPNQPISY